MSIKFRPQLLALEARDVPAAFSFRLANGTTGHGTFATPDGVDPAQTSQALAVPDLTVTRGGVNLVVQPGATANYANGALVGVTASATGPGAPVVLNNALVQVGGSVAPVAYDAAETQYAFQFSNGVGGNISFAFDWNQVNPDLASQALTPTAFNVNIAGQNYAYGTATYTTAPTILFTNGDLLGVSFAVNTAGAGSPFLSVSVGNGIATGIDAITGLPLNTPVAAKGRATLTLDFSQITIPTANSKKIKLTVHATGNVVEEVEIEIFPGATTATITATMKAALEGAGFTVSANGTTQLVIKGTATQELTKIVADADAAKRPKLVGRAANAQGTYPDFDY